MGLLVAVPVRIQGRRTAMLSHPTVCVLLRLGVMPATDGLAGGHGRWFSMARMSQAKSAHPAHKPL